MKNLFFKVTLSGKGIVNFDSNEQKFSLAKLKLTDVVGNDNVKLCKKSYKLVEEDGSMVYKAVPKISSDCMRRYIFCNEDMNSLILKDPMIAMSQMLSPNILERGCTFVSKDDSGYKRKSCLSMSDMIETANPDGSYAEVVREICTTGGFRDEKSIRYEETCGEITYSGEGFIDPNALRFLSADPMFDRMFLDPDWLASDSFFKASMDNLYGHLGLSDDYEIGYFSIQNEKIANAALCEYGVLLGDKFTEYLIKDLLKKISRVSIKRNKAFAQVVSLEVKIVNNILTDKASDPEGWIKINSEEDIDALSFGHIDSPYVKVNNYMTDEWLKLREEYKAMKKEIMSNRAEEKANKKKEREKKKREKEALDNTDSILSELDTINAISKSVE